MNSQLFLSKKFLQILNNGGNTADLLSEFIFFSQEFTKVSKCQIFLRDETNTLKVNISVSDRTSDFEKQDDIENSIRETIKKLLFVNQGSLKAGSFLSNKETIFYSIFPLINKSIPTGALVIYHNEKITRKTMFIEIVDFLSELLMLANQDLIVKVNTKTKNLNNPALTSRQKLILGYLCEGYTAVEISKKLNFSSGTIRLEISKIYAVMGVRTRQEATYKASRLEI